MATLKQMAAAVSAYLDDAARSWSETLTVTRQWAPDFERRLVFRPTDPVQLTVIPGGLVSAREDSEGWLDDPSVGVLLSGRCANDTDADRLSDLVEEVLDELREIDLSAVACLVESLDVLDWVDRDLLLEKRVWQTRILMGLRHPFV
jgi:hypothetical protein